MTENEDDSPKKEAAAPNTSPKNSPARTVKCPYCRKLSLFTSENPYRPFCSDRCRTLDLGDWAAEKYSVPVNPKPETDIDDDYLDPFDEKSLREPENDD